MPMAFPQMFSASNPLYSALMGWPIQAMMGQDGQGLAGVGVNPTAPSGATPAADAGITFPDIGNWAIYRDTIEKRRQANIGKLSDKLIEEGFFEIDQLTSERISHADLAQSLGIGIGLAALIIRFAEEDVAQVRAGTFNMEPV